MPNQKDIKRLVRTRMNKTGESYTSARAQILKKKSKPAPTAVPESEFPKLAGMSDDAVRNKTGRTWKQWVRVLDAVDAAAMPHKDIAMHVHKDHDVPAWWAQMITVGYERIRGLREVNQRRGGKYDMSKSKTIAAPLSKLYKAFSTTRSRKRWLPDVELTLRKCVVDKTVRAVWPDGTLIDVYFYAKGDEKTTVVVQHRELPRKSDIDKMRRYWQEKLEALAEAMARSRR